MGSAQVRSSVRVDAVDDLAELLEFMNAEKQNRFKNQSVVSSLEFDDKDEISSLLRVIATRSFTDAAAVANHFSQKAKLLASTTLLEEADLSTYPQSRPEELGNYLFQKITSMIEAVAGKEVLRDAILSDFDFAKKKTSEMEKSAEIMGKIEKFRAIKEISIQEPNLEVLKAVARAQITMKVRAFTTEKSRELNAKETGHFEKLRREAVEDAELDFSVALVEYRKQVRDKNSAIASLAKHETQLKVETIYVAYLEGANNLVYAMKNILVTEVVEAKLALVAKISMAPSLPMPRRLRSQRQLRAKPLLSLAMHTTQQPRRSLILLFR